MKKRTSNSRYCAQTLRKLRNEISINILISDFLQLSCKLSEGYFRFLCALCSEFITVTNPKTNLARCFRCEKNFNLINMTILVNRWNFRETVQYIEGLVAPK